MLKNKLLNFILFQVCWFACIMGAADELPLLGPLCVAVCVFIQLFRYPEWKAELAFLGVVGVLGTVIDSIPLALGAFSFPHELIVPWGYPIWMTALWIIFATMFHSCLSWLSGRYLLGAAFGAVGGPMSYYAGQELGSLTLHENTNFALGAAGVTWAIVTPLLLFLAEKVESKAPNFSSSSLPADSEVSH